MIVLHSMQDLISMKVKVKVKSLSRVQLFATLWTVVHQAPQFMGFSRQEYWSGLPFPSPGYLPNAGIELRVSRIAVRHYHLSHQGSPIDQHLQTNLYD